MNAAVFGPFDGRDDFFASRAQSGLNAFGLAAIGTPLPRGKAIRRRAGPPMVWAYSSVVEHYVDIVGVASSILATPTIAALSPLRR